MATAKNETGSVMDDTTEACDSTRQRPTKKSQSRRTDWQRKKPISQRNRRWKQTHTSRFRFEVATSVGRAAVRDGSPVGVKDTLTLALILAPFISPNFIEVWVESTTSAVCAWRVTRTPPRHSFETPSISQACVTHAHEQSYYCNAVS